MEGPKYPEQSTIAIDFITRSRSTPIWKRWWPWSKDETPGLETNDEMEIALKAFFTFAGPVGKDFYNYLMAAFYDVPCDDKTTARDLMLHITSLARIGYLRARGLAKTDEELAEIEKKKTLSGLSDDPFENMISGPGGNDGHP